MKRLLFWLCYAVFCNIILFVTCALPWYATIFVSLWYVCLAVPATSFGVLVCNEFLRELDDYSNDSEDDDYILD